MFADPEKENAAYSKRLFDAVLNAVIDCDGDGTGNAGFVRPDIVRDVLAEVAAVVDNNCQRAKGASDRRKFANELAKRYEVMAQAMERADANGLISGWDKARLIDTSTIN